MKTYVEVADIDRILGVGWADEAAKPRAVMIANVWLTNQQLPGIDPIPGEWKQAGAEIAREAAKGNIYGSRETGVLSKSVSAGDVSSSKSYSSTAKTYTAGESLALALLKPWVGGLAGVMLLKRM